MEPEKELSPQESLALIGKMISKTKDSVADSSFYFLLWGWLVFGCCVSAFILKVYVQYPYHYMVWFLMPLGGIVSWIYGSRQAKTQRVISFVDEALDYLWIAVGLAFFALVIINVISGQSWQTAFTYYILLYAIGTLVSGSLLRFRPLMIGGVINFVLAVISIKLSYDYQLLIGAVAILISYIIPGHMLRAKYKKNQ
ncbi:MAG: hypothetical protein V4450_08810 [Bacteroidota bacterium]